VVDCRYGRAVRKISILPHRLCYRIISAAAVHFPTYLAVATSITDRSIGFSSSFSIHRRLDALPSSAPPSPPLRLLRSLPTCHQLRTPPATPSALDDVDTDNDDAAPTTPTTLPPTLPTRATKVPSRPPALPSIPSPALPKIATATRFPLPPCRRRRSGRQRFVDAASRRTTTTTTKRRRFAAKVPSPWPSFPRRYPCSPPRPPPCYAGDRPPLPRFRLLPTFVASGLLPHPWRPPLAPSCAPPALLHPPFTPHPSPIAPHPAQQATALPCLAVAHKPNF